MPSCKKSIILVVLVAEESTLTLSTLTRSAVTTKSTWVRQQVLLELALELLDDIIDETVAKFLHHQVGWHQR
jgi:hypothetical protein